MESIIVVEEYLRQDHKYYYYLCSEGYSKGYKDSESKFESNFIVAKEKDNRLTIDCVYKCTLNMIEKKFKYNNQFEQLLDVDTDRAVYKIEDYKNLRRNKDNFFFTYEVLSKIGAEVTFAGFNNDLDKRYNLGKVKIQEIRIYNVLHGNMNAIMLSNNEVWVYDIGSKTSIKNSKIKFNNINLNNVTKLFISHMHTDHYNYLNQITLKNLSDIYHPFELVTRKSFVDTMKKFTSQNHVVLGSNPKSNYLLNSQTNALPSIKLFSTNSPYSSTNNVALVMIATIKKKDYFLTGDVETKYVNAMYDKAKNQHKISIVVPHHGGYISKSTLKFKGDKAIYTYEPGRYKNIPNNKTMYTIINPNFTQVQETKTIALHNYLVL